VSFGASLYATARIGRTLPIVWAVLPGRLVGVVAVAAPLALTGRLRLTRRALAVVLAARAGRGSRLRLLCAWRPPRRRGQRRPRLAVRGVRGRAGPGVVRRAARGLPAARCRDDHRWRGGSERPAGVATPRPLGSQLVSASALPDDARSCHLRRAGAWLGRRRLVSVSAAVPREERRSRGLGPEAAAWVPPPSRSAFAASVGSV
jgi:hypothetical protein